jgi:hypothetical protein
MKLDGGYLATFSNSTQTEKGGMIWEGYEMHIQTNKT